jgi:hypothetical protein
LGERRELKAIAPWAIIGLAYVTGSDAQSQTAYTQKLPLFRRVLAMGAAILRLFFTALQGSNR